MIVTEKTPNSDGHSVRLKRPKKPPAPKVKFTPIMLRALKPTDGLRYDSEVPGLAFDPSVKSYRIAMRIVGKLVKRTWRFDVPLVTVRKEAGQFKADAAEGKDRREDERKAKAAAIADRTDTVAAIIQEHLDAKEAKAISPRAYHQRKTLLEQFRDSRLPAPGKGTYGARTMSSLKRRELGKFLDKFEIETAARCIARAQKQAAKRAEKKIVLVAEAATPTGERSAEAMRRELNVLFNWFSAQDDDFKNPLVRKTRPGRASDARIRERCLVANPDGQNDDRLDDEWIAMWRAARQLPGPGGVMPRLALVLGARRGELARMRRYELRTFEHVDAEGKRTARIVWHLPVFDPHNPKERRSKEEALSRPLPQLAIDLLAEMDEFVGCKFVFTANGKGAFTNFDETKKKLDILMLAELRKMAAARGEDPTTVVLRPWEQFRDTRRTARTLMSRLRVDHEIRERALGHAVGTKVSRIYDTWEYPEELHELYVKLAELIESKVNPPPKLLPAEEAA
jgi:hypothetical protein